jgi:hypothetical protein
MPDFEETFENTMRSKAALDIAQAFKLFTELTKSGWPRDKAFQVAFMGMAIFHVPGLKPLPEPDPPFFSAASLYETVQKAHSHVSSLKTYIEKDLMFLKTIMKKEEIGRLKRNRA